MDENQLDGVQGASSGENGQQMQPAANGELTEQAGSGEVEVLPAAPNKKNVLLRILGGIGHFFAAIGRFFKKHKILAVLLVIALAALFLLRNVLFPAKETAGQFSFIRTTTLQKTTLADSVSTTGTVASSNVSTVTVDSSVRNYAVKTLNVQVGDAVSEGDVICTLDTTDLEKSIAKEKQNIADDQASKQKAYNKAVDAYNLAVENYNTSVDDQNTAWEKYQEAYTKYQNSENDMNNAWSKVCIISDQVTKLKDAMTGELGNYNSILGKYNDATGGSYVSATLEAASPDTAATDIEKLKIQVDEAYTRYLSAKDAYDTANRQLTTAESDTGYTTYKSEYNTNKTSMESLADKYKSALKTMESNERSVNTAKQDVADALENYNKAATSDNLDTLTDNLAKCTITAQSSGTITSLSAVVGSVITDSTSIATVQDTEGLIVKVTLEEYDVQNVSIGMACEITSDATDGTISGTLTQISPTSTNGTFAAEVSVNGGSNGLLIGMNANVEIIKSSTDDVFVVPYDAVGTEEDGSRYVYVKTGGEGANATFEKVSVTTGESNDYYTEIFGDSLAEGDEVRSTADLTVGAETTDDASATQSGLTFNMGGGQGGQGQNRGERPAGGPGGM